MSQRKSNLFSSVSHEAEAHGHGLQPKLSDSGLHSFVFCQDLSLIFPALSCPTSFARPSNLVLYCGHIVLRRSSDEEVVGLHVSLSSSSRLWRHFLRDL